MSDIQQLLTMLCGVGALCSIGVILIGIGILRVLGRGSLVVTMLPMGLGLIRNLFPKGGNQEDALDYDAPVSRISNYEHQSAGDLRQRAKQSLDFDAQVAQRMNQKSDFNADFSAQSSSQGYIPQGHPLPSSNKRKNNEIDNAPDYVPPSGLGKSKLGSRGKFESRPEFDPFGGGSVDENVAHQAGGSPAANNDIDLGPINLPPDRRVGGRPTRDRRQNRNDANEDEFFGGMLDVDGDGYPDS